MKQDRNLFFVLRAFVLVLLFSSFVPAPLFAQEDVNHWETVVYNNDSWKYFPGTSDPGAQWNTPAFNDASWSTGVGGFGYGDNDDGTVISQVISVFMRKKFTIVDKDVIEHAWFHIDYDDGFIAYLNGTEIARSMMGTATTVAFNQPSVGLHEALLYQGGSPDGFQISGAMLSALLVEGENVLAVQVHNDNPASSDLTASAFFSVGIADNSFTYREVPSWFPQQLTSSNLPLVVINTNGQNISDEPGIIADMGIIYNGEGVRNFITDPFNNFNGKIEVELRGESSQMFPKKSLKIETRDALGNNLNAALLGMPPENDWVLYAPYTDKTFLRDVMTFKLGNDLGHYAPRTRFVELILNNDYQGVYVLMERPKVDKNRVDIATLNPDEITGDDVTGGYLLRVDKIDGNDFPAWTSVPVPHLAGANNINFQYFDPKGENLVNAQRSYIQDFIFKVNSSLTSSAYKGSEGYSKYLDLPAAMDFMLVNEIGKNIDGYLFSTYMHKDKESKGGKLVMGPLWDFNLCYGNVDYSNNSQFAPGWMWSEQHRMFWFRRMVSDPAFAGKLKCRWTELRTTWMTNEYFTNYIDSMATVLDEAKERNYDRWKILGTYVWPNQFVGQTYQDELNFMKNWIIQRLAWMDVNMPGTCDDVVTGSQEDLLNQVVVYPNPSAADFLVQLPEGIPSGSVRVTIINVLGQQLLLNARLNGDVMWNGKTLSGLKAPSGLYVALIQFGGREVKVRLLVE